MNTSSQQHQGSVHYTIKVRGPLEPRWSAWFDGLAVAADEHGDTSISGELPDSAAVFGIISRVRDLGLELLSVRRSDDALPCPLAPRPHVVGK